MQKETVLETMSDIKTHEYTKSPEIIDVSSKKENTVRVMTYNVHGFNSRDWMSTYDKIFEQIRIIDPDVFGIQEIHLGYPDRIQIEHIETKFNEIGYKVKFSKCYINMIGSKDEFDLNEIELDESQMGLHRCALIAKIKSRLSNFLFCTTHLEVSDTYAHKRIQLMEKIIKKLISSNADESRIIIIGGDFNSLRRNDYTDEEWKRIVDTDKKRNVITQEDMIPFIEKYGLVDSFVSSDSPIPTITVWSNRRVDYLYSNIQSEWSEVVKTGLSDHYPVFADYIL
jgi:endonuclease/exonuclease/phosphatase family metal-dependent hydrolase